MPLKQQTEATAINAMLPDMISNSGAMVNAQILYLQNPEAPQIAVARSVNPSGTPFDTSYPIEQADINPITGKISSGVTKLALIPIISTLRSDGSTEFNGVFERERVVTGTAPFGASTVALTGTMTVPLPSGIAKLSSIFSLRTTDNAPFSEQPYANGFDVLYAPTGVTDLALGGALPEVTVTPLILGVNGFFDAGQQAVVAKFLPSKTGAEVANYVWFGFHLMSTVDRSNELFRFYNTKTHKTN